MTSAPAITDRGIQPIERVARRTIERSRLAVRSRLRSRRSVALLGLVAITSLFYFWTDTTSGDPIHLGAQQSDFYNQLADGFLAGHLYLPTKVPQSLLDTPNPYSPPCCDLSFWDMSLYHDKLYIEYGPAPVVALFIPWRLLHIGAIPLNLAVLIFSILALIGAIKCLTFLADRYKPGVRTWKVLLAAAALACGGDAAFMLRNPSIYEASVVSGICFTTWGLYYLGSGSLRERPTLWRLALASLLIGLAAGSHADLIMLALLLVASFVFLFRRSRPVGLSSTARLGAALFGPIALIAILLAAYNVARFGSVFETGENYDIGCNCVHVSQFEPGAILGGGYWYFLAPVRLALSFPYFYLPPPPAGLVTPLARNIQEPIAGIFAIAPITLFLGALPWLARKGPRREVAWIAALLCAVSIAIAFAVTAVGAVAVRYTQRLEADFATVLLIPALVIWLLVEGRRWHQRLLTGLGMLFIAFGSIVGIAISFTGYYNGLFYSDHAEFDRLESATSPIPTLVTMLLGHPVITRVTSPNAVTSYINNYTTLGIGDGLSFYLSPTATEVDIVAPATAKASFDATVTVGPNASRFRRIEVSASAAGKHATVVLQHGAATDTLSLPIQLHFGLNRIDLTAAQLRGRHTPTSEEVLISGITIHE